MLQEFLLTLGFFTRLPLLKGRDVSGMTLAQAAWAFPLAGALVGALGAIAYMLTLRWGVGHGVAGWLTVATLVLLTGGLHEDGLADMADGLAYGRDREQKLAIMRDSRIGSYGVLALVIVSAIRANAIAALSGWHVLWALIAAGACSRAVMALLMCYLPQARADGLAVMAGKPSERQAWLAALIGLLTLIMAGHVVFGVLVLAIAYFVIARLALRHLGGMTGDVLGALQQVSEAVLLTAFHTA